MSHPQLLLLDEPLASLDIGLKEKILPYLARVRDEFEIPMIYVTHNLTEVFDLGGLGIDDPNGKGHRAGRAEGDLAISTG